MLPRWQRLTVRTYEADPAAGANAGAGTGAGTGAGAAAPAAPPAPPPGSLTAAAEAAAAAAPPPPPSGPYVPEGLDPRFKGANERETIDKLWGDIAGRPKVPEKADGYKLELTPEQIAQFGDLSKDQAWKTITEAAHKAGVDNGTLNKFFGETYTKLVEGGLMPKPIDYTAELAKLAPAGERDVTRATAAAAQRVHAVAANVKALVDRSGLTQSEGNMILKLANESAEGVIALEKLFAKIPREHGVQGGGAPASPQQDAARAMFPTHFKA